MVFSKIIIKEMLGKKTKNDNATISLPISSPSKFPSLLIIYKIKKKDRLHKRTTIAIVQAITFLPMVTFLLLNIFKILFL